jgi:septum formation protein
MGITARLVVASASPRRQSLLQEAGFDFVVHPADIDESRFPPHLKPPGLALYLARAKAQAVAAIYPNDVTLGADTVVALGDAWLGKPVDADDARRMLRRLGGTTHQVLTGLCLLRPADRWERSHVASSTVQMRTMSADEIESYIIGGHWRGKAGGYGIQDADLLHADPQSAEPLGADPFVTRMTGSYSNIVGLPIEALVPLLAAAGIEPLRN